MSLFTFAVLRLTDRKVSSLLGAMDFVKDANPIPIYTAHRLLGGVPDYVGASSIPLVEELDSLPPTAFASPGDREYPFHTKAAAWMSAAYAIGSGRWDEDAKLGEALRKAAGFHEIDSDLERLVDAFAQTKVAAADPVPEPKFALTVDFDGLDGRGVTHFYPVNDLIEIHKSARQMVVDSDDQRLPLDYLRRAAVALVKEATAQSISLDDLPARLRAIGEDRLPDFDHALEIVNLRKSAGVVDEESHSLYTDIVKCARAEYAANRDVTALDPWIEKMIHLDTIHRVKYAHNQPTPYEILFSGERIEDIEKFANEAVNISGVYVPKNIPGNLPAEAVQKHFTKEAAATVLQAQKMCQRDPATASALFAKLEDQTRETYLGLLLNHTTE